MTLYGSQPPSARRIAVRKKLDEPPRGNGSRRSAIAGRNTSNSPAYSAVNSRASLGGVGGIMAQTPQRSEFGRQLLAQRYSVACHAKLHKRGDHEGEYRAGRGVFRLDSKIMMMKDFDIKNIVILNSPPNQNSYLPFPAPMHHDSVGMSAYRFETRGPITIGDRHRVRAEGWRIYVAYEAFLPLDPNCEQRSRQGISSIFRMEP